MRQLKRFLAASLLVFFVFAVVPPDGPAEAAQFSRQNYFTTGGVATNASFTGAWIPCNQNGAIGFIVVMTGTSAPVGTWGVDVTNDTDPNGSSDLGATALTLTSDMTAVNPAGDSAAINFLFYFAPAPPAKWIRFKYVRASGGSATKLLKVSVSTSPPGTP
jgi:hypothetical protein